MFDSRTKNADFPRSQLVFTLLLAFLMLVVGAANANAAFTYVNDEDGANDQPGQKDLTRHGVDDAGLPTALQVTWNWDEIGLSGGNTGDACALFDTDGDARVNFALCVTVAGDPLAKTNTRLYSCGDDKVDRCTTPIASVTPFTSTCSTSQTNTDPFAAGDAYPADTTALCDVVMADFLSPNAKLINTCSYPSEQPNSDPSDCVLVPRDGFLIIKKVATPDDSAAAFDFKLDGSSTAVFTANGSQTSDVIAVKTNTTHSILESAPQYWDLTSASCSDGSGTLSGNTLSGVEISADETVTCTFNNTRQQGTLKVIKHVINDNSGTSTADDFSLSVKSGGTDVAGSPQNGSETGTDYTLVPGTYDVSEGAHDGYTATYSGDCDANGAVTLAKDDELTCTITNDDVAHPAMTLAKTPDKTLVAPGTTVTFTLVATNTGDTTLLNLQVQDPQCSPPVYQSGDADTDNEFDVGESWIYTCSAVITQNTTNVATATAIDENQQTVEGQSNASVQVEVPVIPAAQPSVTLTATRKCINRTLRLKPTYSNGTPTKAVLYIDGKRVKTVKSSNPTFKVNTRKYKAGKHKIRIVVTYPNGTKVTVRGSFDKCRAKVTQKRKSPTFTG